MAILLKTYGEERERPKRTRSPFLIRHILRSDAHSFVGRVFDLSIVFYNFDSYADVAAHADCKYVFDVNSGLTTLTRRVESLNLVGDMLWPKPMPTSFIDFPISRYEWLTISADAFLMRYVSVVDCALLLTNCIFELGLIPKRCSIENLTKAKASLEVIAILNEMLDDQGVLRTERNARFHHGSEREFTQDSLTFRSAALYEHSAGGVVGTDRFGRKIDLERFFRQGLAELQRDFNRVTRRLVRRLDRLYDLVWEEFEERFGPRIRSSKHGFSVNRQR